MLKFIKKLFKIKSFEEKCRQYNLPLPTDERWKEEKEYLYSFLDKLYCIQNRDWEGYLYWALQISNQPLVYTPSKFDDKYGKLLDLIQTDRKLDKRDAHQREILKEIS